jgi:hypothetical protein
MQSDNICGSQYRVMTLNICTLAFFTSNTDYNLNLPVQYISYLYFFLYEVDPGTIASPITY